MDNTEFVVSQVVHWLNTPPNGYLGSDYGVDLKIYLHTPMNEFAADEIIAKMYRDIPILGMLGRDVVNIYQTDSSIDGKDLIIQVMDKAISLNEMFSD